VKASWLPSGDQSSGYASSPSMFPATSRELLPSASTTHTDLETDDPLHVIAAGGEHDDGKLRLLAQAAENVKAIHFWQHYVEYDHVEAVLERTPQPGLAVIHRLDLKALDGQIFGNKLAQLLVVVDDEYLVHHRDFTRKRNAGQGFYVSLRK